MKGVTFITIDSPGARKLGRKLRENMENSQKKLAKIIKVMKEDRYIDCIDMYGKLIKVKVK